jgi:hypothetical protein
MRHFAFQWEMMTEGKRASGSLRWNSWWLLLLLLPILPAQAQGNPGAAAKPEPRLAFEAQAVVASGLTPNEKVAWFAIEHRIDTDFSRELVRRFDLTDVGADGTVRLALKQPPAPPSFWVAVDLKSGEYALAAPEGYRLRRPLKPSQLSAAAGDASDGIVDDRRYLIGLVVRPGEEAWSFSGGDGGDQDADGRSDGRVRFDLDQLTPLSGSPAPPKKVKGSDLWFIVDPLKMEIAVHRGGVAQ